MSENKDDFEKKAEDAINLAKNKAGEFIDEAKVTADKFTSEAQSVYEQNFGKNKKILAGVLAIIFGGFGIHKFALGYIKEGIILLATTYIIGAYVYGFIGFVTAGIGIVEGIIYLKKSDAEFYETYQANKKPWF